MSDSTTTPNLGLIKPTYNADEDQWGLDLNTNADTLDALLVSTGTTTFVPVAGGTMKGTLTLATSSPSAALEAASKGYVDTHAFADAPNNANAYGRSAAAWTPVVAIAGGTMTGPLTLNADPTTVLQAATKNYVDAKFTASVAGVASFNNRTGAVGLQVNDVTGVNGALITASDTAPASPVTNQLWFDSVGGQLYTWFVDANSSQWVSTTTRRVG